MAMSLCPALLEASYRGVGPALAGGHKQQHGRKRVSVCPRSRRVVGGVAGQLLGQAGHAHGPEIDLDEGAALAIVVCHDDERVGHNLAPASPPLEFLGGRGLSHPFDDLEPDRGPQRDVETGDRGGVCDEGSRRGSLVPALG